MASKRVSMKGRGADLFFGDYVQAEPATEVSHGDESAIAADYPPPSPSVATEEPVDTRPVAVVDHSTPPADPHSRNGTAHLQGASEPTSRQASTSERSSEHASKRVIEPDIPSAATRAVGAEAIGVLRRAVREPGREVAYVRLTGEEKGLVGDIVHAYRKRGQRTTENEVCRIAINHLLRDYHEHGQESVLARVLASLLA